MDMAKQKMVHWTREPWVWLLICIPASAVVMGIVMATLAVNSYSGLVVDDYYKKGKQINRVIERDRTAWELGLAAQMTIAVDGRLDIAFDPAVQFIPADSIELQLIHATRPGLDQTVVLSQVDSHRWFGQLELSGQGRWNLALQTPDWRLTGSLHYPSTQGAGLLPNYFAE